jgi:hypothetical protein
MVKGEKCPKGYLEREAYDRKAYKRKPYYREDGTKVEGSYVAATHVPPSCYKSYGKTEKGPKTLPSPKNFKIKLKEFGYSTKLPEKERHAALKKASMAFSIREVEQNITLLGNIQGKKTEAAKKIFRDDLEYMKKLYAGYSAKYGKTPRSHGQKGGEAVIDVYTLIDMI